MRKGHWAWLARCMVAAAWRWSSMLATVALETTAASTYRDTTTREEGNDLGAANVGVMGTYAREWVPIVHR